MRTIAIEGLDGSGKSTIAHELASIYEAEGQRTRVVSPYRLAAHHSGDDIYPLWQTKEGAHEAIDILHHVLNDAHGQAEQSEIDVLIFDRHWMTAFTEIGHDEELIKKWGSHFAPTAYLKADTNVMRARTGNDHDAAWMDEVAYSVYVERYSELCRSYGQHLLGIYRNDHQLTPQAVAQAIQWDMNIRR